jgi:hypothetical protein
MARLLVVSRSMALALRLADTHEVVEFPVDDLDKLAPDRHLDAIVLDVGEPALAIRTLDRLRGRGDTTPLLIVSGYQPAWAGLAAVNAPGVVIVSLPITKAALLEGLDLLVSSQTAPAIPAAPPTPPLGWTGSDFGWWPHRPLCPPTHNQDSWPDEPGYEPDEPRTAGV